jgi:hypothetical protein
MPSADQRPQRRPTPRPGTARTHRRGTCQRSCCASCAQPSPSTPAPPTPAGSASGTATAGCTAAPRWRSWVATDPSPSRRRSLPRCWMAPGSSSRAGITCCSPVPWRQHPNSAGPTPTASSSRSHPTCSGPATTPGAWPPRSTCSAPWSPGQTSWPMRWWAIRALRRGGSNQTTPSPSTATRSTTKQQPRAPAQTVAISCSVLLSPGGRPPPSGPRGQRRAIGVLGGCRHG